MGCTPPSSLQVRSVLSFCSSLVIDVGPMVGQPVTACEPSAVHCLVPCMDLALSNFGDGFRAYGGEACDCGPTAVHYLDPCMGLALSLFGGRFRAYGGAAHDCLWAIICALAYGGAARDCLRAAPKALVKAQACLSMELTFEVKQKEGRVCVPRPAACIKGKFLRQLVMGPTRSSQAWSSIMLGCKQASRAGKMKVWWGMSNPSRGSNSRYLAFCYRAPAQG
eukprot:1158195-Pelagomonas_calceolata.AAC.5